MKRINYLAKGILAAAVIVMFTQCNGKKAESEESSAANMGAAPSGLKIAYVEIDTLLTKYTFWNDLNEMMMKKEENIRATLNQKARELDAEGKEFQRKVQNNAFVSRERAEQENARLIKKQQELQELQTRLTNEMQAENQKNSIQLRDSINSFLKIYNKKHKYSMIFSNTGFDNLLYADKAYNITNDIIKGLNDRYAPSQKKK
ncbi:OmpH family outer membrane protein [Bacteroides sedimenti]|uniref:Membrane protein n=1 Tax=Bacteroides sedimenti TaxID=2136147 RepID=A0ABN6Z282_9BACE